MLDNKPTTNQKIFLLLLILAIAVVLQWNTASRFPNHIQRIVFITIDTLRADHLSVDGYDLPTTPFLKEIAKKGIYFTKAHSTASITTPSHYSMFTSRYPYEHGVLYNMSEIPKNQLTLGKILRSSDFRAVGFPAVSFLRRIPDFEFIDMSKSFLDKSDHVQRYIKANENVDKVIDWIQKDDFNKTFAWIHFYDVHQWLAENFDSANETALFRKHFLPEKIKSRILKQGISEEYAKNHPKVISSLLDYDSRIRFVDNQIQRLYNFFEKGGYNEDTLWVITSDHGEGLGQHDYHNHSRFIYQEQIRVPLLFHWKKANLEKKVDVVVSLVDLLPSFLDLLGIDSDKWKDHFSGTSLRNTFIDNYKEFSNRIIVAQRRPGFDREWKHNLPWESGNIVAIIKNESKLILHSKSKHELYDLDKDRGETINLIERHREKAKKIQDVFYESCNCYIDDVKFSKTTHSITNPSSWDENLLDELRSLGYMQ